MKPTQKTETLAEKFRRITEHYTEMRFVTKVAGLEFYSEPISRERMLNRWNVYGSHPANRITGLHRIEGRTEDGPWITV